jgi:hypothetical protein
MQDFHLPQDQPHANHVIRDTSIPNLVVCAIPVLKVNFSHNLQKASVTHAAFWGFPQATLPFSVLIALQTCTQSMRKLSMWRIVRATAGTIA